MKIFQVCSLDNAAAEDYVNNVTGLWWLGAALLVAGSVIIGRREEGKDADVSSTADKGPPVSAAGSSSDHGGRGTASLDRKSK